MSNNYFYFATHTINNSVYDRLKASATYNKLNSREQKLLDEFEKNYPEYDYSYSPEDRAEEFIDRYEEDFYQIRTRLGIEVLIKLMVNFLGFKRKWFASIKEFGRGSIKKAIKISEGKLIDEITNPAGTIKKLYDCAGSNLGDVKPFLPFIVISLDTNTRNPNSTKHEHTGRFSLDFDKFNSPQEAIVWLKKLWEGTINIKPFFGFISPSGKGVKLFCQVDTSKQDFLNDFQSQNKQQVRIHHKEWYKGAINEFISTYPKLKNYIDKGTNDPERPTFIPFVDDPKRKFMYDKSRFSAYDKVVNITRDLAKNKLQKGISKNKPALKKIMKDNGIKSMSDAYRVFVQSKSKNFDIKNEIDKFQKVVAYIVDLSKSDARIEQWLEEKFTSYQLLFNLHWRLYGIFGAMATEEIKRLIPANSNKLDPTSSEDYRWMMVQESFYTDEVREKLTPDLFYHLVAELDQVKNYIAENFGINFSQISEINLINDCYKDYKYNSDLEESDTNQTKKHYLEKIGSHLNQKKIRLPFIKDWKEMTADVALGPSDYLDKDLMEDLFQKKYKDKRIFMLRSQCGSGKNSLLSHPKYGIKGRVLLAVPYKNINDQMAKEAQDNGDRENQIIAHSSINDTVISFRKSGKKPTQFKHETSLKNIELPDDENLVIQTTYDQVLNLTHEELSTIDYIAIDECHTLVKDIGFRGDTISSLIYYLVEYVAKKPKGKTKTIFMSGTPNAESIIIPKILEKNNIENLFQKIKVDKQYALSPKANLIHLDTEDPHKRSDARVNEIKKYLADDRKVVFIFNNKDKMGEMTRIIHEKISPNIKIGEFYAESDGECTNNILSSKIGDFEVVLTTNYFINGININKDFLIQQEEHHQASSQKYAVVVDLGYRYSKINALDTIQAINRFRNRLCEATVFFPKFFKKDELHPSREYNWRNAARVFLGMNKHNYHLLSMNEQMKAKEPECEKSNTERIEHLHDIQRNPLSVSQVVLEAAELKKNHKRIITDMIDDEMKIYQDWYLSLDGYNYLCKDAGFIVNIDHMDLGEELKEVTEDQIKLENEVVKNFIKGELHSIYKETRSTKKVSIRSSNKVNDPLSTSIGEFRLQSCDEDKFIYSGDFHSSYERLINKVFRCFVSLCSFYNHEQVIEALKSFVNGKIELPFLDDKSYIKNIVFYRNACFARTKESNLQGLNFALALDTLSSFKLGVKKQDATFFTCYTICNPSILESLQKTFTKQQFDKIRYKINSMKYQPTSIDWNNYDYKNISAQQKRVKRDWYTGNITCKGYLEDSDIKYLNSYYSKEDLINQQNLENLEYQLNRIGLYKPIIYNNEGEIKEYASLFIPKILQSPVLQSPLFVEEEYIDPELSTHQDTKSELKKVLKTALKNLEIHIDANTRANDLILNKVFNELKSLLKAKDIIGSIEYVNTLINDSKLKSTPNLLTVLSKIQNDLNKIDQIFLTAFKTSEHMTFNKITHQEISPFAKEIFFCSKGVQLEKIYHKSNINLNNVKKYDIYNSLRSNSTMYAKENSPRVRFNGSKITLSKSNSKAAKYTVKAYIVLDENNKILYADFKKNKACGFLCDYAFKNDGFRLKNGVIPVKNKTRGIYNAITFDKDYYQKKSFHKTVDNYSIEECDVNVLDYRNHLEQLNVLI